MLNKQWVVTKLRTLRDKMEKNKPKMKRKTKLKKSRNHGSWEIKKRFPQKNKKFLIVFGKR